MHHSRFSLKPIVESSLFKKIVNEVKWDSHFHSFLFNGSKFQNITCHRMLREYETLWKLNFIALYYSGWGQLVFMQHGKIVRRTCFEFGSIYVFWCVRFCFDSAFTRVSIHLFVFPLSDYETNYKVTWGGLDDFLEWGESMWAVCMCVRYEDCANVMYTINKTNSLNPLAEYVELCFFVYIVL